MGFQQLWLTAIETDSSDQDELVSPTPGSDLPLNHQGGPYDFFIKERLVWFVWSKLNG